MTNEELLMKLKEEMPPEYEFIKGDDSEFGEPDKLVYNGFRSIGHHEISAKIGNSWFYTDCDAIRMITYKLNLGRNMFQFKLLDFSNDIKLIKDWVKNKTTKDPYLIEERHILVDELRKKGLFKKVNSPNIQYTLNDYDREFDSLVIEAVISDNPTIKESLIIQVNKYKDSNIIKKFYTLRKLSNNTKTPQLLSLTPEIEFENIDDIDY